ncbi:MAG: prolyl hydroxylase family protein [Novosphingobium sp.]
MSEAPIADQAAIARVGAAVRARLSADPAVYRMPAERVEMFAVQNFLSPAECEHIMGMIDKAARPSTTFAGYGEPGDRTSSSGDVDPGDSFVRMIERRICDLMGMKPSWGETFQGQRYEPGQLFKGHYDFFNTGTSYWPGEAAMGGQRCWTAMAYLNDVDQGGETDFAHLGLSVPPQAGMLLMWNNCLPDGRPNTDAFHAALPVERGVKYVITKWFRTRPWR